MKRPDLPLRLDDLPMFATDQQIAEAIVGKDMAEKWMRERLPTLASKPGFPPIDAFHGGRPVKLVARFYDEYLGGNDRSAAAPRGVEDVNAWKPSKHRG
ncbi:hypothetical protein ASD50_21700 [Mesorhizobium sp. Root552]|uniref:hypothetical protein n=1 Tax=Mesorhizobium sp. Root552 TaxID=1736555 RepID=UPI0006FA3E55|nr:hypothetical protein [Mesorhizobium sp. Root552]KQZ20309.1 hypothetical protein ASD50_21700 [Mesorhizobium sp. Root552]